MAKKYTYTRGQLIRLMQEEVKQFALIYKKEHNNYVEGAYDYALKAIERMKEEL